MESKEDRLSRRILFRGKRKIDLIGLDTMVFIYHFEKNQRYFPITTFILNSIESGKVSALTSIVTLIETLAGPLKLKDKKLAEQYRLILTSFLNLQLLDIDQEIGSKAAELRAKYDLRSPDAIQVATAMVSRAATFMTNDEGLKVVKEIEIVLLKEFC
jgi:predicted nucleic acid-binding protein